jgi:hypothetical protein
VSFQAFAWAVKTHPGSAADKLVLLGLADRHNTEHDAAYPSAAWLVEFSGLDRKTVLASLGRLQSSGLIEDTGKRVGKTKQIRVFKLAMEMVPKTEQSQKRNGSGFPSEASQKRDTDTVKGTSTSRAKALSVRATSIGEADHLDPGAMIDWASKEMRWPREASKTEWQRFVDSAEAHDRRYKDWMAAWRSWCRSDFCKTKPLEEATAYRQEPMRV